MPTNLIDRIFLACGATLTVAALALAMAAVLRPHAANALPFYAQRTGLPCAQCHLNPRGGGPRNAFGRAFARNGHQLPGRTRRSYRYPSPQYYPPGGGYPYGMMGPGMMHGYGR